MTDRIAGRCDRGRGGRRNSGGIEKHREYSSIDLLNQVETKLEVRMQLVLIQLAVERVHGHVLEELFVDVRDLTRVEQPVVDDSRSDDVVEQTQQKRHARQVRVVGRVRLLARTSRSHSVDVQHGHLTFAQLVGRGLRVCIRT